MSKIFPVRVQFPAAGFGVVMNTIRLRLNTRYRRRWSSDDHGEWTRDKGHRVTAETFGRLAFVKYNTRILFRRTIRRVESITIIVRYARNCNENSRDTNVPFLVGRRGILFLKIFSFVRTRWSPAIMAVTREHDRYRRCPSSWLRNRSGRFV